MVRQSFSLPRYLTLPLVLFATPVPLSAMLCGDPLALSSISSEAERLPAAVGRKAREIVQCAPAAITVVHVVEPLKSPGFVPEISIALISSDPFPVLVSVMVCAALVEPTFTLP